MGGGRRGWRGFGGADGERGLTASMFAGEEMAVGDGGGVPFGPSGRAAGIEFGRVCSWIGSQGRTFQRGVRRLW